jgi:hypothetical protein
MTKANTEAGRRFSAVAQARRAAEAVLRERAEASAARQRSAEQARDAAAPTPIGSPRRSAARRKPTDTDQED